MSAATAGSKRRWLLAATGAGVILAALLALFRVPASPPLRVPVAPRPAIVLEPRGVDELAMRDLAPLFLPTRFNAKPTENPQEFVRTGSSLDRDAEKTQFNKDDPGLRLPMPVTVRQNVTELLADTPGPLAQGIGRIPTAVPAAPPHGGYVEAIAADTGVKLWSLPLPPEAAPAGRTSWSPVEFLVSVDRTGLVGPVAVTTRSGIDEVDNFFRIYLARTFRIGDRLAPGFYRIVVGP